MKIFRSTKLHLIQSMTVFVTVLFLFSGAYGDDIQKQIDTLRKQLLEIQEDTGGMREELDDLKSKNQDWLTEERAEEFRSLVQDLLADADSRASLVGDGLLGGWSNGFFLASSDGRFKLNIGGLAQERYMQSYVRVGLQGGTDRWRGGLENSRTRLNISGHIFDKNLTFLFQPGFGYLDPHAISNSPLLRIGARFWDAWVKYKINDEWSAKLGTFMLPFTKESLISDTRQLAVDRSLLDYRLGLGRSTGIQFTWLREGTRVFLSTSNGAMPLRGLEQIENPTPPWASLSEDTDWSVTARAEFLLEGQWSQFNQFTSLPGSQRARMFGIAFHAQNQERGTNSGNSADHIGFTADYSMNFDGASFFVAGTFHNIKNFVSQVTNTDMIGYTIQGSQYISDDTELFMRYAGGGPIQDQDLGGQAQILTSGANWYIDGHQFKVTSDLGWSFGEISSVLANQMLGWRGSPNRNAEWVLRAQLQLEF